MAKKGQKRAQARAAVAGSSRKDRGGGRATRSSSPVSTGNRAVSAKDQQRRGLSNLGNTCFLNSILQCLNASTPFSDELLELSKEGLGSLGTALSVVFKGLRGQDNSIAKGHNVTPKNLLGQLRTKFPWYKGGEQHDAHELLRVLLGSFSDESTSAEQKALKVKGEGPGPAPPGACERAVWRSFRGHLLAAVLCWNCRRVSLNLEPFLDLSLELPGFGAPVGPMGLTGSSMRAAAATAKPAAAAAADGAASDGAAGGEADEEDGEGFSRPGGKKQRRRELAAQKAAQKKQKSKLTTLPVKQPELAAELAKDIVKAAVEKVRPQVEATLAVRVFLERVVQKVLQKDAPQLSAPSPAPSAEDKEAAKDEDAEPLAGQKPPRHTLELKLSRTRGTQSWGFEWRKLPLAEGRLVLAAVQLDSILDKWNLKHRSMGDEESVVLPGDELLSVDGEVSCGEICTALEDTKSRKLQLRLAREASTAAKAPNSGTNGGAEKAAAAKSKHESVAKLEERRRELLAAAQRCQEKLPKVLLELFPTPKSNGTLPKEEDQLSDCLNRFSLVEALQEEDFRPCYCCSECAKAEAAEGSTDGGQRRTYASRRLWLWPPLPPLLTLQLKRFRRQGVRFDKSSETIRLPPILDLADVVLTSAQHSQLLRHATVESAAVKAVSEPPRLGGATDLRYELYALCQHIGSSMGNGHYTAYVNGGPSLEKEDWYGISDAHVWKCARSEALGAEAYVAFYRREGLAEAATAGVQEQESSAEDD